MPKAISFSQLANPNAKFTPRDLTALDRAFKSMFKDMLGQHRMRHGWKFSVRPSSLPFCEWEAMLAHLYGKAAPEARDTFARTFYVEVGHVVHAVVQSWLGQAGYLYRPFSCRVCKEEQVSLGFPKACPNGCEHPDWVYNEIDLKHLDTSGVFGSAKADGLIRFPFMKPGHYYLIDIKTCSLHTLPKAEYGFTRKLHLKYLHQTAVYSHLLSTTEDVILDGTVFLMIPRDDPKQMTAIIYDQTNTRESIYKGAIVSANRAKDAAATGECLDVKRDCETPMDNEECPFHAQCWDRKATEAMFLKRNGKLPVLPSF